MIRQTIKYWVYSYWPGKAGAFPYFGTQISFPKGSFSFRAACAQGIFEADNVRLLQALVRPRTWYFDVGANIGLMSVPVLCAVPDVYVAAFEPSPNSLPWLERTIAGSAHAARWKLVPKAVGATAGTVKFSLSPREQGLFDGVRHTRRADLANTIEVEQTTLDSEWHHLGRPPVSVIKCDVEGGELEVMRGAVGLLALCKPAVLLEWNQENLCAYHCAPESLLQFAEVVNYRAYGVPSLARLVTEHELRAHMAFTESFLLLPLA